MKKSDLLPCDVHLPPNTIIRKGCPLSTVLVALDARVMWAAGGTKLPFDPDDRLIELRSPSASPQHKRRAQRLTPPTRA